LVRQTIFLALPTYALFFQDKENQMPLEKFYSLHFEL